MQTISWQLAEQILGRRVDRRRAYAATNDRQPDGMTGSIVHYAGRLTDSCSGCTESCDGQPVGHYPVDPKHHCLIGAGCEECGHTGKRRVGMWLPVMETDLKVSAAR